MLRLSEELYGDTEIDAFMKKLGLKWERPYWLPRISHVVTLEENGTPRPTIRVERGKLLKAIADWLYQPRILGGLYRGRLDHRWIGDIT